MDLLTKCKVVNAMFMELEDEIARKRTRERPGQRRLRYAGLGIVVLIFAGGLFLIFAVA